MRLVPATAKYNRKSFIWLIKNKPPQGTIQIYSRYSTSRSAVSAILRRDGRLQTFSFANRYKEQWVYNADNVT